MQFEQQNITNNVKAVLGPKSWSHQNWFDENHESISAAPDAKNKANAEWQRDQSSTSKNEKIQRPIVQNADRTQENARPLVAGEGSTIQTPTNTKQFFNAIKTVCGPSILGFFPLLSFDGSSLIKDQERLHITQQALHSCTSGSSACLATTSHRRT